MKFKATISRRKFIQTTAAALSFVYLPGIGRVQAQPYPEIVGGDYQGRLCYNENSLGPSPKALTAIQEAAALSHRYPDWYSGGLELKIAQFHNINTNSVCAETGATEVLRLIVDAFLAPGDEMITATPTYFQIASEATANGATVVHVPVDGKYVIDLLSILKTISPTTRLISLVNPNNPLGTVVNKTDMENFIHAVLKSFGLNAVYPNPFNSQCTIKISSVGNEKVQLTIYDTLGRKVRSLVNAPLSSGIEISQKCIFRPQQNTHKFNKNSPGKICSAN